MRAAPLMALIVLAGCQTVGVVMADVQVESDSAGRRVSSGARAAVTAVVGAEIPVGPGRATAQAGYLYANVDGADVSGNVGGFSVSAGYVIDFSF